MGRLREWGLSFGTTKNRIAFVRRWVETHGQGGLAQENTRLGIETSTYVSNENRSRESSHDQPMPAKVERTNDGVSSRRSALRCEEAIKFTLWHSNRGVRTRTARQQSKV